MLTRLLNLLGVALGGEDSLTTEPVAHNPKGYWEHKELTLVSDAIITGRGDSWDEPPILQPGWETDPALDELFQRAEQIVQVNFSAFPLWGWKDPRTCLTLLFWQKVIPGMRYIICLRNPVDVARSLENRDGFLLEKSFGLWLTYVSAALKHTEGRPRLVVFYEDLMAQPLNELQRLAEFIGKPDCAEQVEVQKAAQDFIDPRLQHHRSDNDDAQVASRAELEARALYAAEKISASLRRNDFETQTQEELQDKLNEALEVLRQHSVEVSSLKHPPSLSRKLTRLFSKRS